MTGFSLRLPEDLEVRLNREAREEGLPRSEIARAAIAEFLDRREKERFIAAFVKEARAAYSIDELRQEALAIGEEALPLDNEALALAETVPPATRLKAKPGKSRSSIPSRARK
jgi:predicted transcriptional regulator